MRRTYLLAILTTAVAAAAFATQYDNNSNPHAFTQSDCFSCHFTLPTESSSEPLRFTDTISNLCARCHDMSKTISHQVDIAPSNRVNIPPDMPLDSRGRITCITCHDIHRPYINPLTGRRTYFLRRDVIGKNFCISCHDTKEGIKQIQMESTSADINENSTSVQFHWTVMNKSHGFANFDVIDQSADIDPLSLACLDCHGDDTEQKTTLNIGVFNHAEADIGLSHPIGMDYETASDGKDDYVQVGYLDKRLKLFDGKIGCCTCHDPYSSQGGALVIGTPDSYQDLCLACHIK